MNAIDPIVAEVRREVCAVSCTEHCAAYKAGTLNHDDPHAACPRVGWILAWGCYGPCNGPTPATGLGDLVAAVATPIARAFGMSCIDPATSQLRPESKCAERKAALNRIKL
jgi:hypothetical protein